MQNSILICLALFSGTLVFNSSEKTELSKHEHFVHNYEVKPMLGLDQVEITDIIAPLPMAPANVTGLVYYFTVK